MALWFAESAVKGRLTTNLPCWSKLTVTYRRVMSSQLRAFRTPNKESGTCGASDKIWKIVKNKKRRGRGSKLC
jgi:hypothetical protein